MQSECTIHTFDNPQPRCPCILLLDCSMSMQGVPLRELTEGVRQFMRDLQDDDCARFSVEPAVITFGGDVMLAVDFTPLSAGFVDVPEFVACGETPMGEALNQGLRLLDERKQLYRGHGLPYFQPWMVLLTDGQPTDSIDVAVSRLQALYRQRELVFFGVGIGAAANMRALARICPPDRPPKRLVELRFRELFTWLSQSLGQVSRSAGNPAFVSEKLPPTDGWTRG